VKKVIITIETENAAFNGGEEGPAEEEIVRILQGITEDAITGQWSLLDWNGNKVGRIVVK
jgi:hypothetical protein